MLNPEEIIQKGKEVIAIEAKAIESLQNRIDKEFVKAVKLISKLKGRVIITGMGKSGIVGRQIVATLNSTGTPSLFLHPSDAVHGDLGIIRKIDVIICISKSGDTAEIIRIIPIFKRIGVKLIALVSNRNSYIAKNADVILDTGVLEEACPHNLAPTSSSTAALVLGDALAITLLEEKNFSKEDFAFLHPAGNLGKRLLLKVQEMMYKGKDVPIVKTGTSLKDAIIEITSKRLGATCVIDEHKKLVGIITDGDLRRLLQQTNNIENLKAKDLVKSKPKVIKKDVLAATALDIMEQYNITQIIVVDNKEFPIGMVHIHDLVKSGIGDNTMNGKSA
jgi:arabinose-5-phosphate isomerase